MNGNSMLLNSAVTRCPWTFRPLSDPFAERSEYVDRDLPRGWQGAATVCIALAGARASGKSLFIGVLVKLLQQMGEDLGFVVEPADETTQERYETNYETPLFEERGLIAPTPSFSNSDAYQHDPLIYNLGEHYDWTTETKRNLFIVIRDVAGEDLENLPDDTSRLDFFNYADEILFLFDPLKVPQIKNYLKGFISESELGGDPGKVLQNLSRVLNPGNQSRFGIALSKFDTLQSLEAVKNSEWAQIMGNYGSAYRRDNGFNYDDHDSHLLHFEVESLLVKLDAKTLVNSINNYFGRDPQKCRYFATSALGAPPKGSHIQETGIAPYRCMDPINWVLYSYGFRP